MDIRYKTPTKPTVIKITEKDKTYNVTKKRLTARVLCFAKWHKGIFGI